MNEVSKYETSEYETKKYTNLGSEDFSIKNYFSEVLHKGKASSIITLNKPISSKQFSEVKRIFEDKYNTGKMKVVGSGISVVIEDKRKSKPSLKYFFSLFYLLLSLVSYLTGIINPLALLGFVLFLPFVLLCKKIFRRLWAKYLLYSDTILH